MNDRQTSRPASRGAGSAQEEREQDQRELTAAMAGIEGMKLIAGLTGKETEGVTGVEPAEDGWVVTVEVVEDRRIPSSTDVLAAYEIEMALDGDLVSYRRVRRYPRGRGDSEDV
jgi:hypothetical protein